MGTIYRAQNSISPKGRNKLRSYIQNNPMQGEMDEENPEGMQGKKWLDRGGR